MAEQEDSVLDLDFSADLNSVKTSIHNPRATVEHTSSDLLQIIEEEDSGQSSKKEFSIAKHSSLNKSIASSHSDHMEIQTLDGQLSSAQSSNPPPSNLVIGSTEDLKSIPNFASQL